MARRPPGSGEPRRPEVAGRPPGRPLGRAPQQAPGRPGTRPLPRRLRRRRAARLGSLLAAFAVATGVGVHLLAGRRQLSPGRAATGTTRPAAAEAKVTRFGVGVSSCTFVDTAASTYDYATRSSLPGRRLVTEVRYPTTSGSASGETGRAHPAYRHGPFPLVVFAAGFDVSPSVYASLLDAWVQAGFVVAAPVFPDTNPAAVSAAGGAGEEDIVNQPSDVAFVAGRLRAAAEGSSPNCSFVRHLVSPSSVGLAGQSDGADTVAALAYNSTYASLLAPIGVRAVEVLSGADDTVTGSYRAVAGSPALLFVQSRNDTCNTPSQAAALYDAVQEPDKWFLETDSRTHVGPYDGKEPEEFSLVARATTAFFRAELDGGSPGPELRAAIAGAGTLGTLTSGGPAPTMPYLDENEASCYADA